MYDKIISLLHVNCKTRKISPQMFHPKYIFLSSEIYHIPYSCIGCISKTDPLLSLGYAFFRKETDTLASFYHISILFQHVTRLLHTATLNAFGTMIAVVVFGF